MAYDARDAAERLQREDARLFDVLNCVGFIELKLFWGNPCMLAALPVKEVQRCSDLMTRIVETPDDKQRFQIWNQIVKERQVAVVGAGLLGILNSILASLSNFSVLHNV